MLQAIIFIDLSAIIIVREKFTGVDIYIYIYHCDYIIINE